MNRRFSGFTLPTQTYAYPLNSVKIISGSTNVTVAPGAGGSLFNSVGPINPHQYFPNQLFAQQWVYEGLVGYGQDGEIVPVLATSWETEDIPSGGSLYSFTLRENVKFHDGSAWNCSVAKLNFDHVLSPTVKQRHHMKGYDIKLEKKSLKDFNEECLWGASGDENGEEELQSESDTDIARRFIAFMEEKGHAFTRSEGEVFWFNPDHGIYLTGLRQLRVYMNDCPRLPADRRGKTEEQNKWVRQIESIVNDDPDFRNKVVHTTYRKIAFKNGYYDCDRTALCDYNPDVYFLLKGGIEYVPQEQGVLDDVWNKLFMGVFGTLAHGAENRSVCGIHKTVVHELYEYVVR